MDNKNKESSEFACEFEFNKDVYKLPKKGVGANTLYTKRKGNTYYLLEMNNYIGLHGLSASHWKIHTNEVSDWDTKYTEFISDRKIPNQKYVISQYLTAFFKHQKAIPSAKRNRYFRRIQQLLIDKWKAINERLDSNIKNNRQTKTFIRFNYKHKTFYLGFYIGCCECETPVAVVKSRERKECHEHWKQQTTRPIHSQVLSPVDHLLNNEGKVKEIYSRRQKKRYKKVTRIIDDQTRDKQAMVILTVPEEGAPTLKISKHFQCNNVDLQEIKYNVENIEIFFRNQQRKSIKDRIDKNFEEISNRKPEDTFELFDAAVAIEHSNEDEDDTSSYYKKKEEEEQKQKQEVAQAKEERRKQEKEAKWQEKQGFKPNQAGSSKSGNSAISREDFYKRY